MEGLVWLLMKMAVLLAVTGASFLSLGWWLRGRQAGVASAPAAADVESSSTPVSRPELVEKIENLRASLRMLEADRDTAKRQFAAAEAANIALRGEIDVLRSQIANADVEERRLNDRTNFASPSTEAATSTPSVGSAEPADESVQPGANADFSLRSDETSAALAPPPEKAKKPKAPRKSRAKKR